MDTERTWGSVVAAVLRNLPEQPRCCPWNRARQRDQIVAWVRGMLLSRKFLLIAAYLAIYFIWGSTFLAVSFAIETMPPLLMGGIRFLVGGAMLYALGNFRGDVRPRPANWSAAIALGSVMVLIATGGTIWSQQYVSSGLAAVLATTVPLWIVLIEWLRPGGSRPDGRVATGLLAGFAGVVMLVGPGSGGEGQSIHLAGLAVLLCASIAWAAGSVYSRSARVVASPAMATGMQMLTGGAMLTVAGLAMGEGGRFDLAQVSTTSWLAMLFLLVSTVVAFTAYNWLLTVDSPSRVSTYAYINPVVAVFLGWQLAGEHLDARMVIALGVILTSVAFINAPRPKKPVEQQERKTAAAEPAHGG